MSVTVDDPVRRAALALAARGAGPSWIAARLREQLGVRVHRTTIARWIDPDLAERRRERDRLAMRARNAARTGGRLGRVDHSPEMKLERMRALAAARLAPATIAKVMRHDWPEDQVTAPEVAESLQRGVYVPFLRMAGVDGREAA